MKKYIKFISCIILVIILIIVVDMIVIFNFNRPLFAIKEIDGEIYRGIFYDTYNCMEHSTIQIKSKGSKFNCLANRLIESRYLITDINGVSIRISDVTKAGATVIINDINVEPYVYGEWYQVEKLIDGKWYEVNTKIDNYGFNDIGYLLDKNNEVKFYINWKDLYGELENGNYRIIKQVNDRYIAVLFVLK